MENESYNEVNGVDGNKEARMDYMQKLVLAGSAFRLPEDPTKVTPQSWNGWLSGIRATIQDEDILRVEKLKYLWDADPDILHPYQGVPKNIVELNYLLGIGRINRLDIEYTSNGNDNGHPSKTAWSQIQQLKDFVVVKVQDTEPTTEHLRKVVDCIIKFITSNMYNVVEGPPGSLTLKYFSEHTTNAKALRKFRSFGEKLLPSDINEGFMAGFYVDYEALLGAMKRKYNMGNEQKTVIDHFLKLDKILEKETKTEFMMGSLRTMVKKLLVTKDEDIPYIQYYKGHKECITHKEEFGPMANFLLEYIMLSKKVPRSKWKQIEKDYHRLLDGQPSYKKWHENSYELWNVVDKEINSHLMTQAQLENQSEQCDQDFELNAVRKQRQFNRKPTNNTQYTAPRMNMGKSFPNSSPRRNPAFKNNNSNNNNNNSNNKIRNER